MSRATKKSIRLLVCLPAFLGLLASLLSACQLQGDTPGAYSGTLVLEGRHEYQGDTMLPGALVVLDGEVVLGPGARVAGPAFLIGGSLSLNGEILGDVSAIGGSLNVGPQARVEGDLRVGNAELNISPGAVVVGESLTGTSSGLQPNELFAERPLRDQIVWLVVESVLLACAAYLVARFAPGPLAHVRHAAVGHPIVSAAMGLLAGIVGLILLIVIAYTLILIPVTLIGFLAGFLAIGYGWIGIGAATGSGLAGWRNWAISMPQTVFLGTLAFMLALNLFTLLPVVGDLAGIASAAIALGAVVLTRFGLREFVPEMGSGEEG